MGISHHLPPSGSPPHPSDADDDDTADNDAADDAADDNVDNNADVDADNDNAMQTTDNDTGAMQRRQRMMMQRMTQSPRQLVTMQTAMT